MRRGEVTRDITNQPSQVVLVTHFNTEAGHGLLDLDYLEHVEHGLAGLVLEADRTGTWQVPETLIADLVPVVNEYDRQLAQTRMSEVARASDRLEQLIRASATTVTPLLGNHAPGCAPRGGK